MEFLSIVRLREAKLAVLIPPAVFIMSDVALYDTLEYFDGMSIRLDGVKNGCLHSYYPVTRKCRAELFNTPLYAHYVFVDEGGWIRAFTMPKGQTQWINTFRMVASEYGILKGEHTLDQSQLELPPEP